MHNGMEPAVAMATKLNICNLVENLSTAVLVFTAELGLEYMNPAAEVLLGMSARAAEGHSATQLLANQSVLLRSMQDALDSNHTIADREVSLQVQDGNQVLVDCMVTPFSNESRPMLVVEMLRMDRLRRISMEENLLAQNQAARNLVRGIAHEIKNPLGGLRGAAQLLEREFTDDSLKEYTRIIIGEADRLRNLVNNLLGPNKLPEKKETNIHEVLERVRSLVLAQTEKRITICRDYDISIPLINADIDQLIQVILNIVQNAEKAIADNGVITMRTRVERQITIGNKRHRLVARIDIQDNGIGIPEEMQNSIFMPMITGFEGGTGLGLSIAQSVVNQYEGLIEFKSEPGNTIFTILLPVNTEV
jgi:two-component system nitrogen regulation sensor histidine kinase GlnL